jgi:hypothetical protein
MSATPVCTDANEDGFIYVLSGRLGAQVDEVTVEVGPCGVVLIPRGVKHTFWNPTATEAVALEFFAPAGLERWFAELAELVKEATPDIDAIVASARRHGTELYLDSLPDLLGKYGLQARPQRRAGCTLMALSAMASNRETAASAASAW